MKEWLFLFQGTNSRKMCRQGGTLILKGPNGERMPAVVKEVKENEVFIDLNHPLAGKELNFKVKVVAIN